MDPVEGRDHKVTLGLSTYATVSPCLPAWHFQHAVHAVASMSGEQHVADWHHITPGGLHVQMAAQPMNGDAPFDAGQYSFFDSVGDDGGLEGGLDEGLDGGLEVSFRTQSGCSRGCRLHAYLQTDGLGCICRCINGGRAAEGFCFTKRL